jgi:hypothetical protein
VGELVTLKADAAQWLTGQEHEALQLRLEIAHAAAEAAVVETMPALRAERRATGES